MASNQGSYADIPLTPDMARLMMADLNGSASIWIAGGVILGLGVVLVSLSSFSALSWATWIVLSLVGLIAVALTFAGLWRIHLGRQDMRAGSAKRFYGLVTIAREQSVGSVGLSRTTYSVKMPGITLVRTRAEVAEPLFAKHVQIRSALDPLLIALASTDKAHVSFKGWVEFAPKSQFVFRVVEDG